MGEESPELAQRELHKPVLQRVQVSRLARHQHPLGDRLQTELRAQRMRNRNFAAWIPRHQLPHRRWRPANRPVGGNGIAHRGQALVGKAQDALQRGGEIGAIQRLAQELQLDLQPARIRSLFKRRAEARLGR